MTPTTMNASVIMDIPEVIVRHTYVPQKIHVKTMETVSQTKKPGTNVNAMTDFLGETVKLVQVEIIIDKQNDIIIV